MNFKQYFQYRIQFDAKWSTAAGIFAGISFFLRAVYYFAIADLSAVSVPGIIFKCIIPLLIACGYLILLKCLRYNAPGLFGILGCLMCMVIIVGNFTSGDILRVLVSIIWYFVVGALFLGTTSGFLPDKVFSVITLLISIIVRAFTGFLGMQGSNTDITGSFAAWGNLLPEISDTAMLLSLLCFLFCLYPKDHKIA